MTVFPGRLLVVGASEVSASNKSQHKMIGIEFLRFFSAISVLIFHYKNFTYQGLSRFELDETIFPFHDVLWPFYKYGDYGVQVFWCISGFIFFWKYKSVISTGLMDGRKFLVLRFSRLYPLHVLTLVFVALLQLAYVNVNGEYFACKDNDLFHFVLHLFLASNWRGSWGLTFNAPIWSVSVEVLIYALFFVLLRLGIKSVAVNFFIVFACIALRHQGVDNRVLSCVAFFYAGGLVPSLQEYFSHKTNAQWLLSVCGKVLVFLLPVVYFSFYFHGEHGNGEMLFLNIWVPVLIAYVVNVASGMSGRLEKALEIAGNMTYSSYLLHFPLQLAVALYFVRQNHHVPASSSALFVSYLVVTLLAAVVFYKFFEMPAQNWLRARLMQKSGLPVIA